MPDNIAKIIKEIKQGREELVQAREQLKNNQMPEDSFEKIRIEYGNKIENLLAEYFPKHSIFYFVSKYRDLF